MKLNAVAVTSKDIVKTISFYELLGFKFEEHEADAQHVESIPNGNEAKLMIDSHLLAAELIGAEPTASNHSGFAIEFDSPSEVDEVAKNIKEKGFAVSKEPWDAFWGQRYAVVQDPDGYFVDLYAKLS